MNIAGFFLKKEDRKIRGFCFSLWKWAERGLVVVDQAGPVYYNRGNPILKPAIPTRLSK